MESSIEMQKYFENIEKEVKNCYKIASEVKLLGYDPSLKVTTILAKNLSERVEGIISVLVPQVKNSGIAERIVELESIYGMQDWRIAMIVALEVAQEKFCKFKDKKEAMEIGIRVGFSYVTNGVVSSPIEGFIGLEIRKTLDGKDYFSPQFAGPIRSAGGTAASVSVLIVDYVRKHMGYAKYDPTEDEIQRVVSEVHFFHERITNLQYLPSEKELYFLASNLPVQIDGDPSEKIETPRYKDLLRVPTNKLRNGFCLVMAECLSLKAEKVWKQLSRWGKEMEMEHWSFMEEFVKVKKEVHANVDGKKEKKEIPKESEKIAVYLILKADAGGSLEALENLVLGLQKNYPELDFKILRKSLGDISEDDINLSSVKEGTIILGFKIKPEKRMEELALRFKTKIGVFEVVYQALDWLKEEVKSRIPEKIIATKLGNARILKTFGKKGGNQIIGGEIIEGVIQEKSKFKILRKSNVIGEGEITELEQNKIKTKEVGSGQFGVLAKSKIEIAPKDILEIFKEEKEKRL